MELEPKGASENGIPYRVIFIKTFKELFRRLPVSFYLILAIIVMLVLGVPGFSDLEDPRKLAFSMVVFLVFFGAIVYRALMDAIDIARKHYRDDTTLISDVFERDGFAQHMHEKLADQDNEKDDSNDSSATPPIEG